MASDKEDARPQDSEVCPRRTADHFVQRNVQSDIELPSAAALSQFQRRQNNDESKNTLQARTRPAGATLMSPDHRSPPSKQPPALPYAQLHFLIL